MNSEEFAVQAARGDKVSRATPGCQQDMEGGPSRPDFCGLNELTELNDLREGIGLERVSCGEEGRREEHPKRRRVAGVSAAEEEEEDLGANADVGSNKGKALALKKALGLKAGCGYLLRKRRADSCAEGYLQLREQSSALLQKQSASSDKRLEDVHSVQTRAMAKRSIDWLGTLPDEMWAEILSRLVYTDIGKAMCACKTFWGMETYVWRLACANKWPELTARMATVPDRMFKAQQSRWRKCYEMLSLREAENALVTEWGATFPQDPISSTELVASTEVADLTESVVQPPPLQKEVTPHYRRVLVEWMIEVAQEWKLESTMIFQATRYLDSYLRTKEVEISKFQLLGVSAIRLAVSYLRPQMKVTPEHQACLMEPARYAHVCDGAATEAGVIAMTEELDGMISKSMRDAPNAKMYLRCLWYTISKTGISGCTAEDMHVYVLAAFLLELGQTDLAFSTFSHSSLAGASMSLALEFYGKDPWPVSLLAFSSYTSECLVEQRKVIARAQVLALASNVRDIWYRFYQNHLYHDKRGEWGRLLAVVAHRGANFVEMAFGADTATRLAASTSRNMADQPVSFGDQEAIEAGMLRILQ